MFRRVAFLFAFLLLSGCLNLVAPYDATFDQSLNELSEETAKFLAAAETGGPERSYSSQETVAYYATTNNVLERLIQRAKLTRASVPCPTNASLESFTAMPTSRTALPEDYRKFDCREFQLYSVRLYSNQLEYAHESGGTLNVSEAKALGGILQVAIMGAIQTFVVNKAST